MASFGKKKTLTDYLYSKPVLFVLCVSIFLLIFSVHERYRVERTMHVRRLDTETEKRELLERKKVLQERVQYLSGDRGIEEEIRTHFDVAKNGEQVIILVGDDVPDVETIPEPQTKKPWYKFW